MKKWLVILLMLAMVAAGGYYYWRGRQAEQFSERARAALKENDYQTARVFAERALEIRPNDASDLIVYSEAVFNDQTIDGEKRVTLALDALAKISDESSEGLAARTHEASILFFDQLKVVGAELALNRAIKIAPDEIQPLQSLMQIYCCTERATITEPLFKKMIGLATTKSEKTKILSAWFLSQFSTQTYNSPTDQLLRINSLFQANIPLSQKRLLAFRNSDPKEQTPRVALAHWFFLRTDGKQAKVLLDEMAPEEMDLSDSFYLMTAVNVYLECGEIDLARELHGLWTDKEQFEYWRQKGVLEQDYDNQRKEAAESLEKALTIWPGPIDPSVYFRLTTLYKLLGNSEESEKYRALGEKMGNATEVERIRELQDILLRGNLSQNDCLKFATFYEAFGRKLEAESWRKLNANSD